MTALLEDLRLEQISEDFYIRDILTLNDAISLFLEARDLAPRTRYRYQGHLDLFADQFPPRCDVAKVTEEDLIRHLAKSKHLSRGTRAVQESTFASFFGYLYGSRKIKVNPMEFVPRTRKPDPDSLDLKTVSSQDVLAMMQAAESWAERLCIGVLAYLGPRRHAVALLRLSDYDQARGMLRFHEKGGKTIWKPVPDELAALIGAAVEAKEYDWQRIAYKIPDPYLIPPEGPLLRHTERDDRVIWRLVKKVADRAGVDCHVHALRGAFADFWLDSGGDEKALQLLLGHRSPATTQRYARLYDKQRRMEGVRGLSWQGKVAE